MANTTFQQYLQSAFTSGPWSTDEVIEFVLPLFEEVLSFHENGLVGSFDQSDSVMVTNARLDIDEAYTHAPRKNLAAVQALLEFQTVGGYKITDRILVNEDVSNHEISVLNQNVQTDRNEQLTHPVYLPGYQCFEILVGHHDAQTDIFSLGLILGSVVMGLDLYDLEELNTFAKYRDQPTGLNTRMHPTICALVTEMTELDRSERSPDFREIIQRLKYYRDYDPQRQVDLSKLATFEFKKPTDRRTFILSKLRNRLFDTSRRNRLLFYKPNARFVNLTVSSVPMVLNFQSINPNMLFTWNKEISEVIIKQNDIPLNKYLRFEDHPYLNTQLTGIRQSSENDKKEYGFSQLKMVVAFLHWHNLKENINERIQSPLLLLPVELDRKKSLKEEKFTLKIIDNAALVNPILANYLNDLYGITLPESVDFDDHSMEEFFQLVEGKITDAKQGVKLNFIDKPRIRIVHNVARQTINNFRKKLKIKGTPSYHQVDYSYSDENYKPLGLELFRQKVEPKQSSLEFLLTDIKPSQGFNNFAETGEPAVKSTYELAEGAENAYSWDFDVCNIVLGNFNYKKMSLVSDYNKVADQRIDHPVFTELFSNVPGKVEEDVVANDPAEWFHVITADPTQSKAILHSRKGKSYIIQGPPGTGKSQTITNLIADFLAKGKTILFVCEKRAALDVVYHRLQQNHLAELCCYIHDSQGDKKEFFKDLRSVYEDFLKNKMDLQSIKHRRQDLLSKLLQKADVLKQYHLQQNSVSAVAGVSTRQLMENLLIVNDFIPTLDSITKEAVPVYSNWVNFGDNIHQLAKALENTGASPILAEHPFCNLGEGFIKAENPFGLMDSLTKNTHTAIQRLSEIISRQDIPAEHATLLVNIKNLVQDSVLLEPLAQSGNLRLVQKTNAEAREFEALYAEYKTVQDTYAQLIESNRNWQNKFVKSETELAIQLAQKHEKSFFSFLNGDWRRLKKQMQQAYDFDSHQVKPPYSTVLTQLRDEYSAQEQVRAIKSSLQQRYKLDNIDTVYVGLEVLRRKQGDEEIDYLLAHPRCNEIVIELSRLNNTVHQLELQLKQLLFGYEDKSLLQIKDEVDTIRSNSEVLADLLPSLRGFSSLPSAMQEFIRKIPLTPLQAEAAMATKTLDLLYQTNQGFSGTSHQVLHATVLEIEDIYKALLESNSEYIRAVRRQNFLEHYEISNSAPGVLTIEQKLFKQQYAKGRQVIEHEMNKSMRFKSIREVASNESGNVLKDVKPVWLMSPLSVSDSLPLDSSFFDVVIYDEASQISLEEGIPALFRAKQSIIVGDDKQMPPSNFFNAKSEDPEDLEMIEGENEDEILSADADSLLMQASRKLKSTMLSWHYRSRYETLISYSNHAFYDAGLLTIPDRTINHQAKPLLEVINPAEGAGNTSVLLNESMSYHYLTSSVYEARSNLGEAKYIANMIRALLLHDTKETIGIVAFSQEQQEVIEAALDNLALEDKTFEEALEKAYNRKDEGQFTGLFVKNLENVQGDERDIIIMSVCYGFDGNQKMLMNFGPINRKGGEKRLNVIFSRARKHMAVISSIRHYHITNEHNEGANYFRRFLQYAEMVSTGNLTMARTILDSLLTREHQKKDFVNKLTVTTTAVRKALEGRGYLVDERIGQSNFKCSLGVKKAASDSHYCLGILVDDSFHYSNDDLIEQYCQRPSILEKFGWKTISVYAKDWLANSNHVVNSIVHAIEASQSDTLPEEPNNSPKPTEQGKDNKVYTELHSSDGGIFWKILQNGTQLETQQGKIGHKGLVNIKTFLSEIEAYNAKELLIKQKLGEGFNPLV